jgi:TonB family protein
MRGNGRGQLNYQPAPQTISLDDKSPLSARIAAITKLVSRSAQEFADTEDMTAQQVLQHNSEVMRKMANEAMRGGGRNPEQGCIATAEELANWHNVGCPPTAPPNPSPTIPKASAVKKFAPEFSTEDVVDITTVTTRPRVTYSPDPDYTEQARRERIQGICVLEFVLGTDGRPQNIRVKSPLGGGLDERAIATLQQWTFDPATKDGKPVAVKLTVEMKFNLY